MTNFLREYLSRPARSAPLKSQGVGAGTPEPAKPANGVRQHAKDHPAANETFRKAMENTVEQVAFLAETPSSHFDCSVCHEPVTDIRYRGEVGDRMKRYRECFLCAFWQLQILRDQREPGTAVVVNGGHYVIQPDEGGMRRWAQGFGGARFHVAFADGREVITRNLWYQGKIPERFRAQLPNNAAFL